MNTSSRFSFPERGSIADELLAKASRLDITVLRNREGNSAVCIKLEADVGAELFGDDMDEDSERQASDEGLSFARKLLRTFARKDGAA